MLGKVDSKGEKVNYRMAKRRQAKTNDIEVVKCFKGRKRTI